jgi:hypothetical protein
MTKEKKKKPRIEKGIKDIEKDEKRTGEQTG